MYGTTETNLKAIEPEMEMSATSSSRYARDTSQRGLRTYSRSRAPEAVTGRDADAQLSEN
jgi:hypothetical protein